MANDGDPHGRVSVDVFGVTPDCIAFQAGDPAPDPCRLPFLLGLAMTDWLAAHPDRQVGAALPLVAEGNTVLLYLWLHPSGSTALPT